MRWGELVGLESQYVRPEAIRVEWQLYEMDTGELLRCPPKDDSHRTVVVPGWLARLASDQLGRTRPTRAPVTGTGTCSGGTARPAVPTVRSASR